MRRSAENQRAVLAFLLLAASVLAVLVLSVSSSPPASATTASATPAPILSQYENASRSVSSRDIGLSVPLPNGNDLWIFGDTGIFNSNTSGQIVLSQFIPGGTAAEGSFAAGQIPTSLFEVPSPGNPLVFSASQSPAQFPPTPSNVYLPDGSGRLCSPAPGQYSARWVSGLALIPNTPEVLITYAETCVTNGGSFQAEGWGFMEYNWKTNTLDVAPRDVFRPAPSGAALAPTLTLGSPVFSNGRVSLFSFVCTSLFIGCGSGQVYAATLAPDVATLSNPASYSVNPVSTDGSSRWQPIDIAVASYPDTPFRMIETTAITGSYNVMTAPTPTGPWHLQTTGLAQKCQGLPSGFCYALAGHPELSTSSQLVISYLDPGFGPVASTGPVGHAVGIGASSTVPVPGPPQQLSAVASTTSVLPSVQLSWSPPSVGGSGVTYNIYRSTTAGTEQANLAAPIARGVTGTSYTDSGLANGTTYHYVVTATNALGFEGLASNEASARATNCTSYSSPATGAHQVCGAIRAKYQALGGPAGFLGYPTTDETATPDGIGRFNHFANNGSIYWTASTGAWSIHGAIRSKWASLGWESSFSPLGYPVTDETGTPDGIGRFNHFSKAGSIYWTPATGAHEVHGAIRAKWASMGWERSVLGYPVTDETGTPDGIGRFNHFSKASSIYWTPATGAHEVHGAIRAKWASMGWERSCLGYSVSDELAISGGRQSNFQHGFITWNATTGVTRSSC